MSGSKPVTREEFEELKANLFATWVAIGHLLAHAHGKEKASRIIDAADGSARDTEHIDLYHRIDEALTYVRQACENRN
jgi:hypothetical protein